MDLRCQDSSSFDFGEFSEVVSSSEVELKAKFSKRFEHWGEGIYSDDLLEEYGQKLRDELCFDKSKLKMSVF